jgi:hypothetical protein
VRVDIALPNFMHTRPGKLVESKIRSRGAWGLPAKAFEKHQAYDWPDTGASLILILVLSLGLWAAIWGATSLATAVLP